MHTQSPDKALLQLIDRRLREGASIEIGGMGSFWGTFLGGIALGVAQQIGFYIDPGWGIWLGHVLFLLLLTIRPQGLLPKTA